MARIQISDDALTFKRAFRRVVIAWCNIDRVAAALEDRITFEEYIVFVEGAGKKKMSLLESDEGFWEAMDKVFQEFPEVPLDWPHKVDTDRYCLLFQRKRK